MLWAITLWQPWASLMAEGIKTVETRSRPYPWGKAIGERVVLHSAVRPMKHALVMGDWIADLDVDAGWFLNAPDGRTRHAMFFGCALAIATLRAVVPIVNDGLARNCVDVRPDTPSSGAGLRLDDAQGVERIVDVSDQIPFGDFTPGRSALIFDELEKLDMPISMAGAQGLWRSDLTSW